jgi:hypothetical protein
MLRKLEGNVKALMCPASPGGGSLNEGGLTAKVSSEWRDVRNSTNLKGVKKGAFSTGVMKAASMISTSVIAVCTYLAARDKHNKFPHLGPKFKTAISRQRAIQSTNRDALFHRLTHTQGTSMFLYHLFACTRFSIFSLSGH